MENQRKQFKLPAIPTNRSIGGVVDVLSTLRERRGRSTDQGYDQSLNLKAVIKEMKDNKICIY